MIEEHKKIFLNLFNDISQIKCLESVFFGISAIDPSNNFYFQLIGTEYYLTLSYNVSTIHMIWYHKQPRNWYKHVLFEEIFSNAMELSKIELSFYFDLFLHGEEIKL